MRYVRRKTEQGYVLLLSMLALGALTAIVSVSMDRSTTDASIAGTVKRRTLASEVSQTGLALTARLVLDYYIANDSIDSYLDTIQMGSNSGGQYAVIVVDNDSIGGTDQDGDGSSTTDSDKIFRLISMGEVGASEDVIEAFFKINDGSGSTTPPSSDGIGSLGLCADNVNMTRASNISGEDYNPPPYPCSGAACRSSATTNPDAAGVSYNAGTTVSMTGGTPGGTPSVNSNAGIDCNEWAAFLTSASAVATSTFNASDGPFNASSLATEFGTPADPRIIVVDGPGNVTFNGNLSGNGILIIRNTHVSFVGTFTFTGLVLIEDEGGGISISGNSGIFGGTMVMSATVTDSQIEIDIGSSQSRVRYSTEGLGRAADAFSNASGGGSASLEMIAWRKVDD